MLAVFLSNFINSSNIQENKNTTKSKSFHKIQKGEMFLKIKLAVKLFTTAFIFKVYQQF